MKTIEPKQYAINFLGLAKRLSTAAFLFGILLPQPASSAERIFFASDVHDYIANLQSLASSHATSCELAAILGDYPSATGPNAATTLADFKEAYYTMFSYVPSTILTQGNHDGEFFRDGTGLNFYSNLQYNIYVISVDDFTNASTELSSFLSTYNENKVLFVLSHYPLHSKRVSEQAAVAIFNTLQSHGSTKDIVFLWGHNHSSSSYDAGVNYVVSPGGSIGSGNSDTIAAVKNATFQFTYLNAGYVKPIDGTSPSATVVTVRSDDITIDRYGNRAQSASVTRRVSGVPCGNDSCSAPDENACNCYEDCGSRTGSCDGSCGDQGSGDCFCDDACAWYGDCCPDKQSICGC